MLGFAITDRSYLTEVDITVLKSSYCGLCHALRKDYGLPSALFLSYESQFLVVLAAAQRCLNLEQTHTRCPARLFLRKSTIFKQDEIFEFATDVTILLLEEKLRDNVRDDKCHLSELMLRLLDRNFRKAYSRLITFGFSFEVIETCKQKQHKLENNPSSKSLITYLEPTATLISELFSHTAIIANQPGNCQVLRKMGYSVGLIVALADACMDFQEDIAQSSFNPITTCYKSRAQRFLEVEIIADICEIVLQQLFQIRTYLYELSLPQYSELIHNYITRGLPYRIQQCLAQLWQQNHWNGPDPLHINHLSKQMKCETCGMPHKSLSLKSDDNISRHNLWMITHVMPEISQVARELGFHSNN